MPATTYRNLRRQDGQLVDIIRERNLAMVTLDDVFTPPAGL